MRRLAPILALLAASTAAQAAPAARYKGYAAINQTLRERLVGEGGPFELRAYLDDSSAGFGASLSDLLGSYKGGSLDSGFSNGDPNVLNVVLWHVAFGRLSRELGQACSGQGALSAKLRLEALQPLLALCAWPAPETRTEARLLDLWLALVGYDAPSGEFEAWRDFFLGRTTRRRRAPKRCPRWRSRRS